MLRLLGLTLAGFVALGSVTWPAGRDQGVFQWIGGVILDGGAPYRDAWDIKGPLLYYVYAGVLWIGGRHDAAIRVFDLFIVLLASWLLHRLTRRLNGDDRFGADLAVAFLLLAYFGGGFWHTAQPDTWGGLLVLVAVACLLAGGERKFAAAVGCGAGIALATLLKPPFMVYLLLPALHLLGEPDRASGWRQFAVCLLAFLVVVAAALLYLFALHGALDAYWNVLRFTASSYAGAGERHVLTELSGQPYTLLRNGLLMPCLAAAFGLWSLARSGARREARLMAAWGTLALLSVFIQGRYWLYHWTPVSIAVAPPLGVALTHCARRLVGRAETTVISRALVLLICVAILGTVAARGVFHCPNWPAYVVGLKSKEQYLTHFTNPEHTWTLPPFQELAADVAQRSSPEDTVFMWGWDLQVNLLSQRKTPTRFGFAFPLIAKGPLQAVYRREFMAEITRQPPRYVVVCATCVVSFTGQTALQDLDHFPQFGQWLRSRYAVTAEVGQYQLWALASSVAQVP
jgi:hypothetical protein